MATLKSIKNKYLQTSDGTTLGVSDNADNVALLAFKMQAADSIAKFNMVDGFSDAFVDASGVDASGSTNEARNASNYYSGASSVTPTTTGGSSATDGLYTVTSFTGDGSYTFTTDTAQTYDLLVVAGGGGTGADGHGGGGAGGLRYITSHSVAANTSPGYTVVVGIGGLGRNNGTAVESGLSGGDSSISGTGIVTIAGTGGGCSSTTGGSAGGARSSGGSVAGNAGGYSPVEGYASGAGNGSNNRGGGGGGSGAVGATAGASVGGAGGNGVANSITGASVTYAGGGGGGNHHGGSGGSGGSGGGGTGQNYQSTTAGNASGYGSGGGGGGGQSGSYSGTGGNGSDGIVILRRLTTFDEYNDMTLISNATTAEAVPTKGDLVMTYTNGAGTATVNTDVKCWISRDNGSTYTQATLSSEGTTGGHTILTAHNVDISSQPSGTSMRYKITTHNQSASKETRAQAVSLAWA